jgi:hypothetical protein
MKNEQKYYEEHIPTEGHKCTMEIKLFKNRILTIGQTYINGNHDFVILDGEALQALKKMLKGVK